MSFMKFTTVIFPLIIFLFGFHVSADEVYSKTEAANHLYKQGKFEEALKLYEDALLLSPSENNLKMNRGSAQYQLGDYENAEKSYQGALSAKEKKSRAIAHYNLGNILFRNGEAMQRQGDMNAQEQYKAALDHYIQALDLQPSDYDSKWNLQLAHRRIKQMEQQQQQQQNQDKNKDRNKQDKQQQQQNKNDQNQKDNRQQKDQEKKQQDEQKKREQEKKDQEEQQQQNDRQQNKEQQQPQPAEQQNKNDEDRKKEAARIIELYADDADSLNKPMKKGIGKNQQPEKDW